LSSALLALKVIPEEDAPLLQELGIDFNDIMKVNEAKLSLPT
jgi:hypothetical protein